MGPEAIHKAIQDKYDAEKAQRLKNEIKSSKRPKPPKPKKGSNEQGELL